MQQIVLYMARSDEDIRRIRQELVAAIQAAPHLAGSAALKHYNKSFRTGGWNGTPWQARNANAPRNTGRALLVDTGKLRQSLRADVQGMSVTISTDRTYAATHNEGLRVSGTASVKSHLRKKKKGGKAVVKAHTRNMNFTMPQRQFMDIPGQPLNSILEADIDRIITRKLDSIR